MVQASDLWFDNDAEPTLPADGWNRQDPLKPANASTGTTRRATLRADRGVKHLASTIAKSDFRVVAKPGPNQHDHMPSFECIFRRLLYTCSD